MPRPNAKRSLQVERLESRAMMASGDDLVSFARSLSTAGVHLYGADWSANTSEQMEIFEDGRPFLPFVEMTNPDRSPNAIAVGSNVTDYPTWEFANGQRATGKQTLQQLSSLSGIPIPTGNAPSFAPISDQTVRNLSPLHIPVDAYDPNGSPLTITVSSSDSSVVSAEMVANPKSIRMRIQGYGEMTFRLFAVEAPMPVGRIERLVSDGFYNKTSTNSILFHRVIDSFVIQAGDPTGVGNGGSSLGAFDDQFNVNLQHNRTGILSFAKSTDDTNDSQFFITENPQRHLDFNHSVFGQLIEGDMIRDGISRTAVASSNSKPTSDIVIDRMEVFSDTENGLIRLKALATSGSATISVTATNATGQSYTKTFIANAAADNANGGPFLNPLTAPLIEAGKTISLKLTSQDKEGDTVYYDALKLGTVDFGLTLDHNSGVMNITAPSNYTGILSVLVGVRQLTMSTTADDYDTQQITLNVAKPPTAVDDRITTPFARTVVFDVLANDLGPAASIDPSTFSIVTEPLVGKLSVLPDGRIQYTHDIVESRDIVFQYQVSDANRFVSNIAKVTIAIRSPFQNQQNAFDVDGDRNVSPLDVLVLVNDINQLGARMLPVNVPATSPYIDVDGDGTISPLDVLAIVNHLNQRSSGGGGEGEGGSGGGRGGGEMDPGSPEQLLNKIRSLKSNRHISLHFSAHNFSAKSRLTRAESTRPPRS